MWWDIWSQVRVRETMKRRKFARKSRGKGGPGRHVEGGQEGDEYRRNKNKSWDSGKTPQDTRMRDNHITGDECLSRDS